MNKKSNRYRRNMKYKFDKHYECKNEQGQTVVVKQSIRNPKINPQTGRAYLMQTDRMYGKEIYTVRPIPYEPPKWEPYFIFTKDNVFVAKKPRPKRIRHLYRKGFKNFDLTLDHYQNTKPKTRAQPLVTYQFIHVFWHRPLSYEIKKPNYYSDLFFDSKISKFRSHFNKNYEQSKYVFPLSPNKSKPWRHFSDKRWVQTKDKRHHTRIKFWDEFLRFSDSYNKRREKEKLKIKRDPNYKRRLKSFYKYDRRRKYNKFHSYAALKYDRKLFINESIFNYNNYKSESYSFNLLQTDTWILKPKHFPIKRFNWICFPSRFSFSPWVKAQNLFVLLRNHKEYYYSFLYLIKNYPLDDYCNRYKMRLLHALMSSRPKPYWSFIQHWLRPLYYDPEIKERNPFYYDPKDQVDNMRSLNQAKRVLRPLHALGYPLHMKHQKTRKRRQKQIDFYTTYPYYL